MGFLAKTDYFDLTAGNSPLVCVASNDGAAHSVAEAIGQDGAVIASQVYGYTESPSCDYKLKGTWSSAVGALRLGDVFTIGAGDTAKTYVIVNVSISTSAGGEPTVSASGKMVNSGATADCIFALPAFSVKTHHHAQEIFTGAFTLAGEGCSLTGCSASMTCDLGEALKEGETIAFDVSNGRIELSLDIVQTGAAAPQLTAGNGWVITSPLACTNPDSDYATYSATLTKYLEKTTVSS